MNVIVEDSLSPKMEAYVAHLKTTVGRNVKFLRESKNLTQSGLAECSELSVSAVGKVERIEGDIHLSTLAQLSAGLEIHPTFLLSTSAVQRLLYDPVLSKMLTCIPDIAAQNGYGYFVYFVEDNGCREWRIHEMLC